MANWLAIINVENIFIFIAGFVVGRFWKLGKKIMKQINEQDNKQ